MNNENPDWLPSFAAMLNSYAGMAKQFEDMEENDEAHRRLFAFALIGAGANLSEAAASVYRIGRVLESLHDLTKIQKASGVGDFHE